MEYKMVRAANNNLKTLEAVAACRHHEGSIGSASLQGAQGGQRSGCAPGGMGHPVPLPQRGNINAGAAGGGLGDILGGLLGGKAGPAAAGAKPSGSLGDLLGGLLVAPLPEAC